MTTYGGIPAVLDETSGGDRATARRYEEVVFEATYADGELRPHSSHNCAGVAVFVCACAATAWAVLSNFHGPWSLQLDAAAPRSIEATNAAVDFAGFHPGRGYPRLEAGSVIEPHAATTLRLRPPPDGGQLAAWAVAASARPGDAGDAVHASTAAEAVFVPPYAGHYVASATLGGEAYERPFLCRYVRRSLRAAAPADRAAFLDAVQTLRTYGGDEGRKLYGPDYLPLAHFVAVHLALAGDRRGDRLHDGLGFVTQHVALTNAFERALRVVAPGVSVPYWDYTEDHVLASMAGGDASALWATDVWSDDVFGNASGSRHHAPERGRFAYARVPDAAGADRSPYGYLRAPWNVNRSPFVARFHKLAGASLPLDAWSNCYAVADFVFNLDSADSWYAYAWAAGYLPHGPVHTMVGGYAAPAEAMDELRAILGDDVAVGSFANGLLYLPKDMYRDLPSVQYPKACSRDAPQAQCHVVCPKPEDYESSGFLDEMKAFMAGYQWYFALDEDRTERFLRFLCETPFSPGDILEAGAPNDVAFWPIHPFVDRLLQYKRVAAPFADVAWRDPGGDTRYCARDDATACQGHHAEDLTVFATTVDGAAATLSNGEVFAAANPHDYKLDYIYDTFDMDHCDALGANATAFPHFPRLAWWGDGAGGA